MLRARDGRRVLSVLFYLLTLIHAAFLPGTPRQAGLPQHALEEMISRTQQQTFPRIPDKRHQSGLGPEWQGHSVPLSGLSTICSLSSFESFVCKT